MSALPKILAAQSIAMRSHYEVERFNAQYTDRDGRVYPALIQHAAPAGSIGEARESEPLFRVWVNGDGAEVLFKASSFDGVRERVEYYELSYDADNTQRQRRIGEAEALEIIGATPGVREFRCLLFMPPTTPHSLSPGDPAEPYSRAIKIPVVDLLVDFGDPRRGPRINHVGNVRHQRHAGQRIGEVRMPYYVECEYDE